MPRRPRHLERHFANITYNQDLSFLPKLPGVAFGDPVPEFTALVVEWYCDRWRDYATPRTDRGWEWFTIDHEAIRNSFRCAHYDAAKELQRRVIARQREEEARTFPTLDAWLAAELRDQLTAPAPEERAAYHCRIDHAAYWETRKRLGRVMPRLCRCGVEFQPERRGIARCPACRGKAPRTPQEAA